MTSLCLIFAALVALSCVHGSHTRSNATHTCIWEPPYAQAYWPTGAIPDMDIKPTQREEETGLLALVQIPVINALLTVSSKLFPFYAYLIRPIINFKGAAFTLIANITTWLYRNYFSILIGTAAVIGYCVIGGAFTQELEEMDHRLMQAARQLDVGILKYARIIN